MAQQTSFEVTTITASGRKYIVGSFPSVHDARKHVASRLQQNTAHNWYTSDKFAATCRPDLFVTDPESGWRFLITAEAA